ncbi:DUF5655 domain-containing protein [Oscillospiraceae bacterium OttesenSCG-928-F05]|nr:DUF5655 domain-containing protein [Oscillospiraceae bacterium OttesenSCG-928-F05]
MNPDIMMLFGRLPGALPIYEAAEGKILAAFPDVKVAVKKTQVSFSNRYGFAYLWPPTRKIKGRPGLYIVLSFGLGYRLEHPRVVESAEPYPGRFTHHVLIGSAEEMDAQIMTWLKEAYDFSAAKGRRPSRPRPHPHSDL